MSSCWALPLASLPTRVAWPKERNYFAVMLSETKANLMLPDMWRAQALTCDCNHLQTKDPPIWAWEETEVQHHWFSAACLFGGPELSVWGALAKSRVVLRPTSTVLNSALYTSSVLKKDRVGTLQGSTLDHFVCQTSWPQRLMKDTHGAVHA